MKDIKQKIASIFKFDKLLHSFIGTGTYLTILLVLLIWLSLFWSAIISLGLVTIGAVLNEVRDSYDRREKKFDWTKFDWMDITYSIFYPVIITLIIVIIL